MYPVEIRLSCYACVTKYLLEGEAIVGELVEFDKSSLILRIIPPLKDTPRIRELEGKIEVETPPYESKLKHILDLKELENCRDDIVEAVVYRDAVIFIMC